MSYSYYRVQVMRARATILVDAPFGSGGLIAVSCSWDML